MTRTWTAQERRAYLNSAQRAYYKRNKALVIERNRIYRQDPIKRERIRLWYAANRRKIRAEFVMAYGGRCTCCGESEADFLTLEHSNKDGMKHRQEFKGIGYLYDLRRRGWPKDGYTILCYNCNCVTKNGRICPHRRLKEKINGDGY